MTKLVTTEKREEQEDCVVITTRTREVSSVPSWVGQAFVVLIFLTITAAVLGAIGLGWEGVVSLMKSTHHAGVGLVMVFVIVLSVVGPVVLWTQLWCHMFEKGSERGRVVRSSTRALTGTAREADILVHREQSGASLTRLIHRA